MKKLIKVLFWTFLPVIVLIFLKVALLENAQQVTYDYFFQSYVRSLWLEMTASAVLLMLGWFFTRVPGKVEVTTLAWLVGPPVLGFVLCIILTLALPRFGASNDIVIWLGACIGALSLGNTSIYLARMEPVEKEG